MGIPARVILRRVASAIGIGTVAAVLSLGAASAASLNWTITGPGTTSTTASGGTTDLSYALKGSSVFSTQTWTASATAVGSGPVTVDWAYSGFHSFFRVRAFLNAFSPSGTTSLVNAGPANCCSTPSNGFSYSGTTVFNVSTGDVFGFTFGGSNYDRAMTLKGTLSVSPVPLPATGLMMAGALGGLGALRRRRKSRQAAAAL